MTKKKERRRWERESPKTSEISIIYPEQARKGQGAATEAIEDTLLVYVLNRSEGGLLLESSFPFKVGSLFDMQVRFPNEKTWLAYEGKVVRTDTSPDKRSCYQLGVELQQADTTYGPLTRDETRRKRRMFHLSWNFSVKRRSLMLFPKKPDARY